MQVYVDYKRMRPLTRDEIRKLRVGDKVFYVNGADELNTQTYGADMRCRVCKVLYEAEVTQVTKYLITMECLPIPGSVHGWNMINKNLKPHTESISRTEGNELSQQWLYKNVEWEYVDE